MTAKVVLRLIDTLYSCAEGVTPWPAFLDSLAGAICASVTSLTLHSLDRPTSSVMCYIGADSGEFQKYVAHYASLNPWFAGGASVFPEGKIVSTEQIMPRSAFQRTTFYNEWGKKNHVTHALGGSVAVQRNTMCFLAVNRGDTHRPFSTAEGDTLQSLMPHLRRAVDLHNRLGLLEEQQWVLNALAFPLFHVASNGSVLWANTAGDLLLRFGRGLFARNGKLHAEFPEDDDRLRGMIGADRRVAARSTEGWGGWLRISRGDTGENLALYIVRPPFSFWYLTTSPSSPQGFLIFVANQTVENRGLQVRLRDAWGLTPAEGALATELLESDSLLKASERLQISRNTAKTQLSSIFAKAGVRRQADLVRRLLALAVVGDSKP